MGVGTKPFDPQYIGAVIKTPAPVITGFPRSPGSLDPWLRALRRGAHAANSTAKVLFAKYDGGYGVLKSNCGHSDDYVWHVKCIGKVLNSWRQRAIWVPKPATLRKLWASLDWVELRLKQQLGESRPGDRAL